MTILILDNYDSFTYNLYHMVEAVMPGDYRLVVKRNDEVSAEAAGKYDKIIISPGPGLPCDAGVSCDLVDRYAAEKSILGVCLGHQAIAEVFGGSLMNLDRVLHGKAIKTFVTDKDESLFFGCPKSFHSGRYHSWVVNPGNVPNDLKVTAVDEHKLIMAIRHVRYDVKGVQFHPESIMTESGQLMLKNWVQANPGSKPF